MFSNELKNEKYEDYKNYIKGLENEYCITFKKIEFYINQSSKLNSLEKNNCFVQIIDTFLSAQEEGKPVNEIAGLDLKRYCDDMIYGQSIYSHKLSKSCFILLGILYYISFINFFSRIFKGASVILSPMRFGIADIILIICCVGIPKIISRVTRDYFKNPVHYKKMKMYTYYIVWIFTFLIYSFMGEVFKKYVIVIPFSKVVLILIYLTIISLVIFFMLKTLERGNLEDKKEEKEYKYFQRLSKQYEIHVKKRQSHNKTPLDFNIYKSKRAKSNFGAIIMILIEIIILLILTFLLSRGMLVKENVDILGITLLLIISFFDVVMVSVVKDLIRINKKLIKVE